MLPAATAPPTGIVNSGCRQAHRLCRHAHHESFAGVSHRDGALGSCRQHSCRLPAPCQPRSRRSAGVLPQAAAGPSLPSGGGREERACSTTRCRARSPDRPQPGRHRSARRRRCPRNREEFIPRSDDRRPRRRHRVDARHAGRRGCGAGNHGRLVARSDSNALAAGSPPCLTVGETSCAAWSARRATSRSPATWPSPAGTQAPRSEKIKRSHPAIRRPRPHHRCRFVARSKPGSRATLAALACTRTGLPSVGPA
jgi:hypothetical protein